MQLTDFQVTVHINFYLPLFSLKTSRTSTNKHRANQITFHTSFRKGVYKERIRREKISRQREYKEFKRYVNFVSVNFYELSFFCEIALFDSKMRFLGKTSIARTYYKKRTGNEIALISMVIEATITKLIGKQR